MNNLKLKRNLFLLTSSFIIISTSCYERKYEIEYEIIESEEEYQPFAKYSNGFIYIGDEEYLNKVKSTATDNDILILDERNTSDPNFLIFDSYRINDKNIRNSILEVLIAYEKLYPTKWNRNIESMRNEWDIHNLLYNFNYKHDHTEDVDLNNADEKLYDSKILSKILWN